MKGSSKGHVPNKLKSLGFQKPPAAQPGREHGLDSASVLLGTSPASLSPGCCQTLRAGSLNLSYLRSLPKRCVISELQSHGLAYPEGRDLGELAPSPGLGLQKQSSL